MYKQYTTEHETEIGKIKITRTYNEDNSFDDMFVVVDFKSIDIPNSWKNQTDRTIIRKICSLKGISK